jgi:hypothetical protein
MMIGSMTATSEFRGQKNRAPGPLELASSVRIDRKSTMFEFRSFAELAWLVSKNFNTFFLYVFRQAVKLIFGGTVGPGRITYLIVKFSPGRH